MTDVRDNNVSKTMYAHAGKYKNRAELTERQERRRREFLQSQKQRRYDALNLIRQLTADEDEADQNEEQEEEMEETASKSRDHSRGAGGYANLFKNQQMCSDWLAGAPENFATDWVMKPCPEGRRLLVVASKGFTKAYTKSGFLFKTFSSALPGDVGINQSGMKRVTVIDCIFIESESILYALDLICWNGMTVFDSDTEFRFSWLQSKLQETPQLAEISNTNELPIKQLPYCYCNRSDMEVAMKQSFPFKLDGLLFYHKGAHYTAGKSPLVGWLKPFMLPQILNIEIPSGYLQGHESADAYQYMAEFDDKYEHSHKGHRYGDAVGHVAAPDEVEKSNVEME